MFSYSLCPQLNVSFKAWLNFYFQKTLPDAHMPLLQPNAQYHHCLIFAWPHCLPEGHSRGLALVHVHQPWSRHVARVQVRQNGQVSLTAAAPTSLPRLLQTHK